MIDYSDFIVVYHKAGNRVPQKVRKYKASCDTCGKDRGYLFKVGYQEDCVNCSRKKSYSRGRVVNHNFYGIRFKKIADNKEICTRSSWESGYIDYLVSKNIKFVYEPRRFDFKDGSTYLPDFYLPDIDTYIEIKGWMRPKDQQKLDQMSHEYPSIKLVVLRQKDLISLGVSLKSPNAPMTVAIKGKLWQYFLLREKEFRKKIKDDTVAAFTDTTNRKIYFSDEMVDRKTIFHEVYHCFYDDLCLHSADMEANQIEEINAELISRDMYDIFTTGDIIWYHLLKRLKDRTHLKLDEKAIKTIDKDLALYKDWIETIKGRHRACQCLFENNTITTPKKRKRAKKRKLKSLK